MRADEILALIDAQTERWIESPYTTSDGDLTAGLQLLQTAKDAGVLTVRHINAAARVLIAHWRLDEARALVKDLPQWKGVRLPNILTPQDQWPTSGFRLWNINKVGDARLSVLQADLDSTIIVTTGMGCGFSRRALHEIQRRPAVASKISRHTRFISLPDSALDVSAIVEWEERNSPFKLEFIHRLSDWPMIERFATPVFYFFSRGELKQITTGWPEGGNMDELEAGLQNIGL
ncbi:hypothetical protein [Roseateles sp. YR242]|uniref:hypothetical protein n=1 Tax=Roseateles sp. YR242 TaxID=1855305 RepID=UPI0011602CCF|nr:hypothetical protein [Roseateles sp. YR242]